MNYLMLAVLVRPGEFAERLREMMWTAYGKPVKWGLLIVCVFLFGGAILGFIKRLLR